MFHSSLYNLSHRGIQDKAKPPRIDCLEMTLLVRQRDSFDTKVHQRVVCTALRLCTARSTKVSLFHYHGKYDKEKASHCWPDSFTQRAEVVSMGTANQSPLLSKRRRVPRCRLSAAKKSGSYFRLTDRLVAMRERVQLVATGHLAGI